MTKPEIKCRTLPELKEELREMGEKPFRAGQIFQWLHQGVSSFDEMTNVSKQLRAKLSEQYLLTAPKILRKQVSKVDGTIKYLWELHDGNCIESVFMRYHHGNSACVSSQVGCRMGCKFCASGLGGLVRSLSAGEILDQILFMQKDTGERISNIVLMGTGEPLDNYDNVLRFIRLVGAPEGLNIGQRHISLSTSGLVPQIRRLAEEKLQITLSISLHSPDNESRSATMPVNKSFPVEQLIAACRDYFDMTGRRISYEYTMIDGVSDRPWQARKLAELLRGRPAHVNLIPLNHVTESGLRTSPKEHVAAFQNILEKNGVTATVRRTLGPGSCAAGTSVKRSGKSDTMKAYGKTDKGLVRANNQDTFRVDVSESGMGFLVLCDGMGGARAGNIASERAANRFLETIQTADAADTSADTLADLVEKAVKLANTEVFELSQSSPAYNGMGTTLVGGICVDDRVILANVGDSRAYLIDGDKIAQMSADHSLVAEMVRSGRLTKAEAKTYPGRNLITRAVGVDSSVEADVYEIKMHEGQTLLLCSDGLSGPVTDAEIAAAVSQAPTMEQACTRLIELACKAGGNDNITVVLYTK